MRIGEVSARTGVSVRMLRHYDSIGLVNPSARTSADYRDYSPDDLSTLMRVEALRSLGMGLAEVRDALQDDDLDVPAVIDRLREDTRERIRAEQELLDHLDSISTSAPSSWDDVLHTTALLTALREGTSRQRQAAAMQSPTGRALEPLVASYLEEEDINAAGALRWSLVRNGTAAVEALAGVSATSPEQRRRIVQALGDVDHPHATAALQPYLQDTSADVRASAALALSARGVRSNALLSTLTGMIIAGDHDTDAAEHLDSLTTDDPTIQREVVEALLAAAHRSGPEVRLRIVQALGDLHCTPALRALTHLSADADPRVAGTARHLLDAAGG